MKLKTVPYLFMIIISQCLCELEFSADTGNYSIELLYFTHIEIDGNVVVSPFGIWTLMAGVASGVTENSYSELGRILRFKHPKNRDTLREGYRELTNAVLYPKINGVKLTNTNFVILDKNVSLYPEFRSAVKNDFDMAIKILDFNNPNTAQIANSFIENVGGVRVTNVLKPDDLTGSKMIMANIVTFKGNWTFPFKKSYTTRKTFFDEDNKPIGKVTMMYQKAAIPFSSISQLQAFVIELPYGNYNKYSMLLLLPHVGVKLTDMYKNLAKVSLKEVLQQLENDVKEYGLPEIAVQIPRFRISTNYIMNKPLNNLGVYDIFQPELANFENATPEKIFVSAVVHKAEIEMTETETVATGVSFANVAILADYVSTPPFLANRPFVFFLIEKPTATMIFGGIYSKPPV